MPDQTMVTTTVLACTQSCAPMLVKPVAAVTQSVTKPGPPRLGALNTPVSSAPRMPPTACTPNTSSVSSAPSIRLSPFTPQRQTTPAARPITNAPGMPTLPAAGVIATRPATAPEAAPSIEGLPLNSHSPSDQESTAQAVARKVFRNASAAELPASSADPALKPNQPTQRSDAPIIVSGRLWGDIASRPKPIRLPARYAPTRPATPALMCTTVPPAKSSAPHCQRKPAFAFSPSTSFGSVYASGPIQNHTMCAIGT